MGFGVLGLVGLAFAVEGMWLPEQATALGPSMTNQGLTLAPGVVGDPKGPFLGAILSVDEGCSGAFVSADGLILTNHHCAWDVLQHNTTPERDLFKNGFISRSRAEELPGGGVKIYQVEARQDVTAKVLGAVKPKMSDAERLAAVEMAEGKLIAACEKQPDRRCAISREDEGAKFWLVTRRIFKNVKLVYAPPDSVGSFGGDLDNFEWPRHDGDFSMLRVYNDDGTPYHPPQYLHIQPKGLQPGDFAMVAGYPGSTQRNALSMELRWLAEAYYPQRLTQTRALMAAIEAEVAKDPANGVRAQATLAILANGRKYVEGILDGVKDPAVWSGKEAEERQVQAWIEADPARKAKYGPAVAELRAILGAWQGKLATRLVLRQLKGLDLYVASHDVLRWAEEQKKPDAKREPGYQARDREVIAGDLEALEQSLWMPVELAGLRLALTSAAGLRPEDAPELAAWLKANGGVDGAVAALSKAPVLGQTAPRVALLGQPMKALEAVEDPWMGFARALLPLEARFHDEARAVEGAELRLKPLWMEALRGARGAALTYPDANNTLRLTYGTVMGYSPRDAVSYAPFTTVSGMLAKVNTGRYTPPPAAVLTHAATSRSSRFIEPKLGDVPLCFLTDLDTTGGNSGSATVNGQGELVGLLFDGNYESMASDWVFLPPVTRSVHVDVRYLLFTLDGLEGGAALISELGVK